MDVIWSQIPEDLTGWTHWTDGGEGGWGGSCQQDDWLSEVVTGWTLERKN